jgi:glycerol kinase
MLYVLVSILIYSPGVLASKVDNTAGVYFVPAFNGLYAPYWDPTARGLIIGLTAFADKNHIARAALESVCFQTREILEAMSKDSGIAISTLHVDGGMTVNKVFMQIQSDILGMPVDRPRMVETTALGAAMAAGVAVGVDLDRWQNADEMISYTPSTTSDDRDSAYSKWKEAVKRSLSWDVVPEETPPSFPVGMVTAIGGIVFAATAGSLLYLLRRGR